MSWEWCGCIGGMWVGDADEWHCIDPKYEEEVSGCTSTVGIVTKDKIYVVCH